MCTWSWSQSEISNVIALCVHVEVSARVTDGYYVTYKPITLSCILFMFIEMKFIHCQSCVMFVVKSMSMCND